MPPSAAGRHNVHCVRASLASFGSALVLVALGTLVAGCGGSSGKSARSSSTRPRTVAQRVCGAARGAARPPLGTVRLRVESSDPTYVECLLSGRGVSVDVVAQATAQAWMAFDTFTVHQAQAYGSGGVHVPSQLPHAVPGMRGNVAWIPARHELVATNGTESRGGSYVTVTVTRAPSKGTSSLPLARAVARAVLAVAPRGPNPAPPSG